MIWKEYLVSLINGGLGKYFHRKEDKAADALGISNTTLSNKKRCPDTIKFSEFRKMAKLFHWSDEEIIKAVRL